jgi:hypothetical protein
MNPLIATYFSGDIEPSSGPVTPATAGGFARGMEYFVPLNENITPERCDKIVSKASEWLGEYDFFFEWFKEPTMKERNDLIKKVDATLAPLGVKYTITTKK